MPSQALRPNVLGPRARTAGLARLRTTAPTAEIIVTGTWNDNIADLADTHALYQALDHTIADAAKAARARGYRAIADAALAASGYQ